MKFTPKRSGVIFVALTLLLPLMLTVCQGALSPGELLAADSWQDTWLRAQLPLLKERFGLEEFILSSTVFDDAVTDGLWLALLYFVHPENPAAAEHSLIVNEAGEVVNYVQYPAGSQGSYREPPAELRFPAWGKEEVYQKIEAFLAQAFPELTGQLAPPSATRLSRDALANITLPRLYRGIPVLGDYLRITLDQQTGEVNQVARWRTGNPHQESPYPAALNEAEAWAALRRQQVLELVWAWRYISDRVSSSSSLALQYSVSKSPLYLDASSGKLLEYMPMPSANSGGISWRYLAYFEDEERDQQIADQLLLSPQQAMEVLTTFPGLDLASFELVEYTYYHYRELEAVIYLNLSGRNAAGQADPLNSGRYTLWVDARTGTPLAIDGTLSGLGNSEIVDTKLLSAAAMKLLELTVPHLLPQLRLGDPPLLGTRQLYPPPRYELVEEAVTQFHYPRLVQGIPFYDHEVVITFASQTGRLLGFNYSWDATLEFPDLKVNLSLGEAYEAFRQAFPLQLHYLPHYLETQPVYPPIGAWEANLVYYNNELNWAALDAVSGKPVYQTTPEEEEQCNFTDLVGHPLEAQIIRTLDYLMLPGSGEFRPEAIVNQMEFFTWLNMLYRYAYPEYQHSRIISNMIDRGVVAKNEVFPAKELTQMEGIRFMVDNLGFKRYTHLTPGIYKNPLELPWREAAYFALATGLKIIDPESFVPDALLTRRDAIMLIHNYLAR
ncbi:MAG: hypothetical protein FWF06_00155 [Symbiobacteriaceae bacterium]|nr:hypothetical protein [Symbiobacteriaceae bacterium]